MSKVRVADLNKPVKPDVIVPKDKDLLKMSKEEAKKRIAQNRAKAQAAVEIRSMSDEEYSDFEEFKKQRAKKKHAVKKKEDSPRD